MKFESGFPVDTVSEELSDSTNTSTRRPTDFFLSQNYPNPSVPATRILFGLPRNAVVTLSVYDICGRLVITLVDAELSAGAHAVDLDTRSFACGVYPYRLEAEGKTLTRMMIVLK